MNDIAKAFNRIPLPQKVLMLLLTIFGVGVLFYLAVYSPVEEDIAKQTTRKNQLVTQETEIRRKVANKEEIEGELTELRGRKSKIEKVLPEKAELPSLLQKIYGQAKIVGLDILKFEPGSEVPQALYTEIPVSMTLKGTFDEVANFFYYVGRMERVVNMKNISMQRDEGKQFGTGDLIVTCEAITYRSGVINAPSKGKKTKKKSARAFRKKVTGK